MSLWLYCCQLDVAWEDKPANWENVRRLLRSRTLEPGALLVLPEMFATGFSMNAAEICERDPSPTELFLARLAVDHGIYVLGGVARLASDGRRLNEAVAFSPAGDCLARYAKMRPFVPGGEAAHYAAGNAVTTFCWGSMVASPFICYDLRFPELFRGAVRQGAQLFPVLANWPSVRTEHWITLLRARAIENQAYVAGVNRCGRDPQFAYDGRSLIVDPMGEIVAQAGGAEVLIGAELKLETLQAWRKQFPVLDDLRPEEQNLSPEKGAPPGAGPDGAGEEGKSGFF